MKEQLKLILLTLTCIFCLSLCIKHMEDRKLRKLCFKQFSFAKAKQKSCFLRPDTGPCRADIVQWYYDAQLLRCFRFFWGGCQGNGNRFQSRDECHEYCYVTEDDRQRKPFFCDLPFDFGTCFGDFKRWGWDRYTGICKEYKYSGCGGNQNNFNSIKQCQDTCLKTPNNTMDTLTTCIPFLKDKRFT